MKPVTHAVTMNGRISGELKDRIDTPEETILKRLDLLDGKSRYSLSLWALPEGVPFDRVNLKDWPQEYIQAAGSRDRLTVELRVIESDGPHQYVIGRSASFDPDSAHEETIAWDSFENRVLAHEVFEAGTAAEVFVSFYSTGSVPVGCTQRPLDL